MAILVTSFLYCFTGVQSIHTVQARLAEPDLNKKAKHELEIGVLCNMHSLLRCFLVQLRLVRRRHVLYHILVAILLSHLQEDRVA